MQNLINTFELAVCLVLPLIIFYQRSQWQSKTALFTIPILYLIWYSTYGTFHELSHLIGVWISGKEIFDYQLITQFWKGQFGTGYVNYDYQADRQDFFIIALPYFRDLTLVIVGFMLLIKKIAKQFFIAGLIWILFVLSSLYDVINNYIAFLMGSKNDFNALMESSNAFISNFIGISISLIALYLTVRLLIKSKHYPKKNKVITN